MRIVASLVVSGQGRRIKSLFACTSSLTVCPAIARWLNHLDGLHPFAEGSNA